MANSENKNFSNKLKFKFTDFDSAVIKLRAFSISLDIHAEKWTSEFLTNLSLVAYQRCLTVVQRQAEYVSNLMDLAILQNHEELLEYSSSYLCKAVFLEAFIKQNEPFDKAAESGDYTQDLVESTGQNEQQLTVPISSELEPDSLDDTLNNTHECIIKCNASEGDSNEELEKNILESSYSEWISVVMPRRIQLNFDQPPRIDVPDVTFPSKGNINFRLVYLAFDPGIIQQLDN